MATQEDIDRLKKHLGGAELEWVLSGLPVVAIYEDGSAHLGEPFTRNQKSDCLLLWVGLNNTTGDLFFALTHRVASSREGCLLYLIIPSESLEFSAHSPAFWTNTEDMVLLQTHIGLYGSGKSRVITPSNPVLSSAPAPAMALLRKFKTWSKAVHFELFANYNSQANQSMRRVQTLVQQRRARSPSIDLGGLYPGTRDGVFISWEVQGWREDNLVAQQNSFDDESPLSYSSSAYTDALLSSARAPAATCAHSFPREAPPS
jgi:hypothetical protein